MPFFLSGKAVCSSSKSSTSRRTNEIASRSPSRFTRPVSVRIANTTRVSFVTPSSTFDYDMNTGKSTLLKQQEVPGGFDRANYQSERVFATASDGTRIPMSMVYRKGVKMDGSAPLLLYGYGSYGASIPPTFSSTRLSLLDRGVIF